MRLPDFLVIGAARSGTTALATFLDRHPRVHIPWKEPNFFSGWHERKQFRGPQWPRPIDPRSRCGSLEEYASLFAGAGGGVRVGEASTTYLEDPDAPAMIRETVPDVKLIALLRQPAERAFAHFVLFRHHGLEPEAEFQGAVEQEVAGLRRDWNPHLRYIDSGRYSEKLARYRALFPPCRLKILLFDEWRRDAFRVWSEVLEHLELEDVETPDLSESIGPTHLETPAWRLVMRARPFWGIVPAKTRKRVRLKLQEWLWTRPVPSPALLDELTERFYRDEIARLEELLGRDLDHWRRPGSPHRQ